MSQRFWETFDFGSEIQKPKRTVVFCCGLRARSDMYARSMAATAPLVPHSISVVHRWPVSTDHKSLHSRVHDPQVVCVRAAAASRELLTARAPRPPLPPHYFRSPGSSPCSPYNNYAICVTRRIWSVNQLMLLVLCNVV